MIPVRPTRQFKRDLQRAIRQGRDIQKVEAALEILSNPQPLPDRYQDHKLKGVWRDFRECHLESDWLLIYLVTDFELRPVRLGTHTELFD